MNSQEKKKQLQETYAGVRKAIATAAQDEVEREKKDRKNARIEALAAELMNGRREEKGGIEDPVDLTVTETIQKMVRLLQLAGKVDTAISQRVAARFPFKHARLWIQLVAEIEGLESKHLFTALGIENMTPKDEVES